jgi:hypothetical protein
MTVSWRKGVNLWSFARRQHRGVLARGRGQFFGGNVEGLLAHVHKGSAIAAEFNMFLYPSDEFPCSGFTRQQARALN